MTFDLGVVAALILWGAIVGLDLVSFPQALLSRPIVAGAVAGWIAGDPAAGLRVGVLLELFALELLPIGGSRYPDFGPATVVATAIVSGHAWQDLLGVAGLAALVLALVGGRGIEMVRRANGARVRRAEAGLAAGDPTILARLQRAGLATDALRAALLTAAGLGASMAAGLLGWVGEGVTPPAYGAVLTHVLVAGGLLGAVGGVWRRAARDASPWLLLGGLVAGGVLAWYWL